MPKLPDADGADWHHWKTFVGGRSRLVIASIGFKPPLQTRVAGLPLRVAFCLLLRTASTRRACGHWARYPDMPRHWTWRNVWTCVRGWGKLVDFAWIPGELTAITGQHCAILAWSTEEDSGCAWPLRNVAPYLMSLIHCPIESLNALPVVNTPKPFSPGENGSANPSSVVGSFKFEFQCRLA